MSFVVGITWIVSPSEGWMGLFLSLRREKSSVNLKNSKRLREEKRCRGHMLSIHFLEAEWVMHQLAGLKEGQLLCWGIHGNSDKPCAKERSDDACYCSVKLIRPMDKTHCTCAMQQHRKSCSLQPSGGNCNTGTKLQHKEAFHFSHKKIMSRFACPLVAGFQSMLLCSHGRHHMT